MNTCLLYPVGEHTSALDTRIWRIYNPSFFRKPNGKSLDNLDGPSQLFQGLLAPLRAQRIRLFLCYEDEIIRQELRSLGNIVLCRYCFVYLVEINDQRRLDAEDGIGILVWVASKVESALW